MPVPEWVVVYAAVGLIGVIAGLLLRFLVTLLVVVTVLAVIGVWFLGLLRPGALGQFPHLVDQYFGGLPIGPQLIFTLGGLVFLTGVLIGVLLTTRLYGVAGVRPAA